MRRELAIVVLLLVGCGSPEDAGPSAPGGEVEVIQQFLTWSPAQALVDEHMKWHDPNLPCDPNARSLDPAVQKTGGRACSFPGEDFLMFHRSFLSRLRNEYVKQGLTADITPWYEIPAEMKADPAWSAKMQQDENAMLTMIDPATGKRFTSLDKFGSFIETSLHGQLHILAWSVYGDQVLTDIGASPRSTYFFKIHGFIEWIFQRYQAGGLNRDGNSDLLNFTSTSGSLGAWFMAGTTQTGYFPVGTQTGACNWYVGAVADVNHDGYPDIIWHGPGCSRVTVWLMDRALSHTVMDFPTAMSSRYALIGSGDYNQDGRPDLVWRDNTTNDVRIWLMNHDMTIASTQVLHMPTGYTAVLPGDIDGNGNSDLVLRTYNNGYDYYVMYVGTGRMTNLTNLPRSRYTYPIGIGSFDLANDAMFGTQPRRQADIIMQTTGPGSTHPSYAAYFETSATLKGTADYGLSASISPLQPTGSVFSGPR